MKKANKFVAGLTPIAMAVGLSVAAMQVQAGSHGGMRTYAGDTRTKVVYSGFGECWQASGGKAARIAECGDKVAKPAPAPAPAPMPMDSDGDGVYDSKDACPGTPRGSKVDMHGCADNDNDGVIDRMDDCPNSKPGAKVNKYGCEVLGSVTIQTSADHFDFDSAVLKPAMESALDDVASKLAATPADESVSIVGHTDSTGPAAYNQILSERRAQAAADYLSGKGVKNVSVSGAGESSPIADNGTRAGRAANRRVEIHAN